MRDLLLSGLFLASLAWSISSPSGSILVLNWIWFQRPYDFSWGLWNMLPMFQMAIVIAILSNWLRSRIRFRFPPLLIIYLAFLSWITISCFFAYDSDHAWSTYKAFLPSMWVAPIFLFSAIHDLNLLKKVLWVSAGGIGFNAFKVGLVITARGGGHLTDEMSGFVGDNNVFGLVLCLVVATLMGLRRSIPKRKSLLILFYIFVTFIVLCIIYTQSRGALVSLGIIFFLSSLLAGKPIRNLGFLALVAWVGYQVIPTNNFERLSTLQDVNSDESAKGRFENWRLAWRAALDHPLIGVGLDNHIIYNKAIQSDVQVRVAHSVYFQILGELGFPGLGLYLGFIGLGMWILFNTWRAMIPLVEVNPDLVWARDVAFWITCGYGGYIVGSGLLNMLFIEFPWYVIFYGSMLLPLANQEIARRKYPTDIMGARTIVTRYGSRGVIAMRKDNRRGLIYKQSARYK